MKGAPHQMTIPHLLLVKMADFNNCKFLDHQMMHPVENNEVQFLKLCYLVNRTTFKLV